MDYKRSTLALRVENTRKELEVMIFKSIASGERRQVYWNLANLLEELETEITDQELSVAVLERRCDQLFHLNHSPIVEG